MDQLQYNIDFSNMFVHTHRPATGNVKMYCKSSISYVYLLKTVNGSWAYIYELSKLTLCLTNYEMIAVEKA